MKVLKIGVLLAFAAALSSCEIPFALDDVSEPVIYVQYIPAGGSDAPGMRIAYADPAFGKDDGKRYSLSAGDVLISVNGKAMPLDDSQIESDGNMFTLRPGCRFAPGDKVRVEVKGHGVKDIHAETTVPQMPEIASVVLEKVQRDSSEATRVLMTLPSAVSDRDYYGLKTAIRTTAVSMTVPKMPPMPQFRPSAAFPLPVQLDTTVSVIYTSAGQIATTADINNLDLDGFASISFENGFISSGLFRGEPMMLLSSRRFDGAEYSFYVNSLDSFSWSDIDFDFDEPVLPDEPEIPDEPDEPVDPEEPEEPEMPDPKILISSKQEIRLELYRLSDELYNYCKAQYLVSFNMLSNFGVTPPNFTYSNIIGGIGIVGAMSVTTSDWQTLSEFEMSAQDIMEILFPKTPGGH